MPDLVLSESEQQAMRHLLGANPCPGTSLPSAQVLHRLSVLIPFDGARGVSHDGAGRVEEIEVGRTRAGWPGGRDTLAIEFDHGPNGYVRVLLTRRWSPFTERDRTMARLVAPVVARLVRERRTPSLPSVLTLQERTVLSHVAAGSSNAVIARDLGIAESTVRKHLEHAYRKLGVTGRMAAMARLQERDLPELDLKERLARMV